MDLKFYLPGDLQSKPLGKICLSEAPWGAFQTRAPELTLVQRDKVRHSEKNRFEENPSSLAQ
jgi:hypothetical protein